MDYLQILLPLAIPPVAALLNDPRPQRAWLRVLIVVLLTLGAAAFQMYQAHTPFTLMGYAQTAGVLFVGSQTVHKLFAQALGKLERGSGQGLGVLVEALLKGGAQTEGGTPAAKTARERLLELQSLADEGLLTEAELIERRKAILENY